MKNKQTGISLIVLMITILVMTILAAAVILNVGNNNSISNANKLKFQQDLSTMQDEVNKYTSEKQVENLGQYSEESFESDEMVKLFPSTKNYKDIVKVVKGKIVLTDAATDNEVAWALELGIEKEGTQITGDLYTDVSIGDYVAYPVSYSNITLDGQTETKTGWRVIVKDDNTKTLKLISAGVPQSIYLYGVDGTRSNVFNSLINKYLDSNYATNVGCLSLNEMKQFIEINYKKYSVEIENTYVSTSDPYYDLLVTSVGYWFKDNVNETGAKYRYFVNNNASLGSIYLAWEDQDKDGATYGIRPVVTLQQGLRTTGKTEKGVWTIVK